jgi:hydroxymethylpyrimidine/phosphomethylpyrimidine kinase
MLIARRGLQGAGAVTALTVQNSLGIRSMTPVDLSILEAEVVAVLDDLPVHAVKCGLLPGAGAIRAVAKVLSGLCAGIPLVVDPILRSSSGCDFAGREGAAAYVSTLGPLATILTPNVAEALELLEASGCVCENARDFAVRLRDVSKAQAVLVKSVVTGPRVEDILADAGGVLVFSRDADRLPAPHGTGCALSTAIACHLAAGRPIRAAVAAAIELVFHLRSSARRPGRGVPYLDYTSVSEEER